MVAVSTDRQSTNDRFQKELCLPFAVVGDEGGAIASAYGARWPVIGLARRITYLVGRNRKVLLAFESQFDVKAHAARVQEALAAQA